MAVAIDNVPLQMGSLSGLQRAQTQIQLWIVEGKFSHWAVIAALRAVPSVHRANPVQGLHSGSNLNWNHKYKP